MLRILLVASEAAALAGLEAGLSESKDTKLSWASSGEEALELVDNGEVDVVVIAEQLAEGPALAFVKRLVRKQPLINCAMVNSLPPEEFHEETEGLGVFMQLPVNPGAAEAKDLLKHLEAIAGLIAN